MANVRQIVTKPEVIRNAIRDSIIKGIKDKFPIECNNYKAVLTNIEAKQVDVTPEDQTNALMRRTNLNDAVFGDIDILDKDGRLVGQLQHHRLISIPYYTNRYTLLLDGHEYSIVSQMRTKSGVYTRKRGNDELEAAFNLAKGANFKLIMDPDTGIFKIDILGHTLSAFAVLHILGATNTDIKNVLGDELFTKNSDISQAQIEKARNNLYDKLVKYKSTTSEDRTSNQEKEEAIRAYFNGTSIDSETTKLTLGKAFSSVNATAILEAVRKMLSVYKGEEDIDERDNLEFQKIFTVEDLLKDVIDKTSDITLKIKQKLNAYKPSSSEDDNHKKLKDIFSPVYFTKPLQHFITTSSLARMPSQINPVEFLDSASIITRLGEGGISSERAVPFETRGVNSSYIGVIDPIAAPESSRVGIDVHCTIGARKGDDNEFYKEVLNCKNGNTEEHRVIELYDKYVGFPDPIYKKEKSPNDMIAAVYRGKITKVKRSQLDYQIASPHALTTYTTNTIPFMNANQGNRLLMGDKHIQQSLPLAHPEKRLVSTKMGNDTIEHVLGSWSLPSSPVDGIVLSIGNGIIKVKGVDGKKYDVEYNTNLPLATKTFLDNKVTVKVGDRVSKNQPLADSNYTSDGTLAMGRNLTVAYMPYLGLNHEDGVVLSESTAKNMSSVHADKVVLQLEEDIVIGKKKWTSIFPTTFTAKQLDKLDDNGVIKVGEKVVAGDPLILAMKSAEDSQKNKILGLLHKSLISPYNDISEVYEEPFEGEVTGTDKTNSIITVVLKIVKTLQVGDKVAGSYGNKGVCSKIVPDDQMPRGEDGKPMDAVVTSTSVISRVNPAQILESTLGKIAKKKGITYEIENYSKPDYVDFVQGEMKKYNVSDKETVFDPITGKHIPGVFVGVQHYHKLFKTSDSNFAGRGIEGPHDQNEAPTGSGLEGPKAIGGMEVNALVAHNARAVLKEGTVLRSSKNTEFWKAFQKGLQPNYPLEKKTFTRFTNLLMQAGINMQRKGDELSVCPLTDKDVLNLSNGEIQNSEVLFNYKPVTGGLFDPMITGGLQGTNWAHIKLPEPIINPVFEDAAKSVLGVSTTEIKRMATEDGGKVIRDKLNSFDIPSELKKEEEALNSGKLTKGALDTSVKRVGFLRALNELGMNAGDAYTLSVVPVVPPNMRPISLNKGKDSMTSDSVELYKDLINNCASMKKAIDNNLDLAENRKAMLDSMGALTGVIAPTVPRLKNKGIKGALDFIAGDVPKEGFFQDKVIYSKMNLTGRSTITPDTSLGLDEIGLPKKMAWEMYKPFVMRQMAQLGYNPLQAKESIEKRTPIAQKILNMEMQKRPVITNRAPTLWRHGILAAKPKLVDDTNLHINSLWETGLNADYDGDAMQVHLPVTEEGINDAFNMLPSKQIFSDKKRNDLIQAPSKEPIIGLYKVTENVGKPVGSATVHKYKNVDEAWKDYYAGKLKMTDYVSIG